MRHGGATSTPPPAVGAVRPAPAPTAGAVPSSSPSTSTSSTDAATPAAPRPPSAATAITRRAGDGTARRGPSAAAAAVSPPAPPSRRAVGRAGSVTPRWSVATADLPPRGDKTPLPKRPPRPPLPPPPLPPTPPPTRRDGTRRHCHRVSGRDVALATAVGTTVVAVAATAGTPLLPPPYHRAPTMVGSEAAKAAWQPVRAGAAVEAPQVVARSSMARGGWREGRPVVGMAGMMEERGGVAAKHRTMPEEGCDRTGYNAGGARQQERGL